jgi:lauroyl/myristoyl acyltransferase
MITRKEKDKIKNSIDYVFGGNRNKNEIRVITKNVFRGILSHYFEKIYNAYEDINNLRKFFGKNIEAKYLFKLDEAILKGRGVLFVTGHYGAIEYIPIFLALNGYPVSVVAKFATKQLEEEITLKTKDIGLRIINASENNNVLMRIVKELKSNRILFIECDEIEEWKSSNKSTVWFLRKQVSLDRTIDIIQRRTDAAIIFGIMHRFSLKRYSLIMKTYEDMLLTLGNRRKSSIGEMVLKSLEEFIYYFPDQWYQWKNYPAIETETMTNCRVENLIAPQYLEPALREI